MIDDGEDSDNANPEKTVTVSVGDGANGNYCSQTRDTYIVLDGSKVVAQTPDGTRVATPNPSRGLASTPTRTSGLPKTSYAAALKTKPSDWHLEFSMDDHNLPLDLTIYGAIHQHEARKKTGQSLPVSMIWQGIYTVKFRKVAGPAPSAESTSLRICLWTY